MSFPPAPLRFLAALVAGLMVISSAGAADPEPAKPVEVKSPVSPEGALEYFKLPAGLKMEVVAAEPEIVDPVACRFDEDGRLWVVEMRDYPHPPAEGELPKSRIKVLEDRNGDGRFETVHVFADHLLFATGVQPWNGGVIATVSGRVLFLKDTDGDLKADKTEVWFQGFTEENPQLRVNHPRFALDNHVYVASGLRGGQVVSPRAPNMAPIDLRSRDLRFDPRGTTAQSISGNGQFGVTFDDWGNRFLCSNRNPCMHVVLEDRYASRNPLVAIPAVIHDVAAAGELSRVYALTEAWTTSNLHAGQFTAACGVDIYRGDALPVEYRGNVFTCEPTGNLVHREVMQPAGATFTGRSPHENGEFLASYDDWFRPVNIEGGPDGALYVVDMYRAVIEHPQFMPPELKNRPDLLLGTDRGRIYRIVPVDYERPSHRLELSKVATKHLIKLLEHASGWWRETAARLIYERQDQDAVAGLVKLSQESESPKGRMQALWALQGLGALEASQVSTALRDSDAHVREQAILLSNPSDLEARGKLVTLAKDESPRVRFRVALELGASPLDDESLKALASIAVAGANDPWTRRAVLTSIGDRPGVVLRHVLSAIGSNVGSDQQTLVQELAAVVGAHKDATEIADVAAALANLSEDSSGRRLRIAAVLGMSQGMRARGTILGDFIKQQAAAQPKLVEQSKGWFASSVEVAANDKLDVSARLGACELLGHAGFDVAGPVLMKLAKTGDPQEVRLRAIAALSGYRDPSITPMLIAELSSQTPAARAAMLDALLAQVDRVHALLDEIAAGRMKPTAIDTTRAQRLLKHRDAGVVKRVNQVMASALPADRTKALEQYRACLALAADAKRGQEVFRKNCGTCHKIGTVGTDVGPSIGDTRTKTPDQLLTDILLPNRAIDNNFMSYSVVTSDGVAMTGIILAETANSVTIKLPEGKIMPLLRSNIDVLQSNGVSLMPEGLEKNIPLQDMADVIAFLKNWRYLSGRVPLGAAEPGK